MPLINLKVIEGIFSDSQKQEFVKKFIDAVIKIEGENMQQVTRIVVKEVKSGDWGIGGKRLTTSGVRSLAAADLKA